ncbi:MAG: DUF5689 domain-containing protein [Weeksellaceae bacterium]
MNKFKLIKNGVLLSFIALSFTSCVDNDDYDVPPIVCNQKWEANTTITDIHNLNDTATPLEVTEDLVLSGYVVSSDETGNFFKTIVIQDQLENPTAGMSIEVDITNNYTQFPVGSRILVNAKGLYLAKDKGTHKIGTTFTDGKGEVRVGRMPELEGLNKLAMACDPVAEVIPTTFSSIKKFKESGVVNTLVKLENVQFKDVANGETFYDEKASTTFGGATNRTIVDKDGNEIILRTSSYATFAATQLPTGSGSITAVLSAYASNNNPTPSTYQLFIRDIADVQMENPRFNGDDGGDDDGGDQGAGIIGGDKASFKGCQTIDFENYTKDDKTFPEYINDAKVGDRYWTVKEFSSNKYVQLTAFNAETDIESYFVIPVDFDLADSFSFKSKDGYNKGDVLSVYYIKSYDLSTKKLDMDNLVDITSAFKISTGSDGGYGNSFIPSGEYDLSNITGKGAIVFAYKGSGSGATTTMQLDDIKIVDNQNPNCN